ncbi:class I SAM-dependent methyltransferase [Rhodococcus fascians]|nr:class I SAM-dependent methyltransferase [Rhodococcus fascians]MBY4025041.1 class I SAM-dependent methyltransferase [Rhodococcus fascians]
MNAQISPSPLVDAAAALREAFDRAGYDADGVLTLLGSDAHAALGRSEPVPVRNASLGGGDLGVLVRLFLLVDDCPEDEVAAALAPLTVTEAIAAGILTRTGSTVRTLLDIRPLDAGHGTRWIVSDPDGSMRVADTATDHVLGVGQASLSLLRGTPTSPVDTVLDVGTGCGVQAVHACDYATTVTATDISPRSMDLAAATTALNGLDVELLHGSWFEPVAGRTFDRIVANPPFVVGRAEVLHSYRDSGLDLDGASALMIAQAPEHLTLGGTAAILASWVHIEGEDWRTRVASWLPAHGVDAWVVERDVADPALYVGTWMRDGGLDPRDPDAAAVAQSWLDHFAAAGVEGVGFGFVYLRKTDSPTDLLAEELTHGFSDPLGNESLEYFSRLEWLRDNDILDSVLTLDPNTALERVFLPGDEGWAPVAIRVHRGNGPQWQHDVDELGAALLAGLRPDGLAVGELVELLAAAHGEDADELAGHAVTLMQGLVRHGLVLPAR